MFLKSYMETTQYLIHDHVCNMFAPVMVVIYSNLFEKGLYSSYLYSISLLRMS